MPRPVEFEGNRLPASYANFYIGNQVVLVPVFNDPADEPNLSQYTWLYIAPEVRSPTEFARVAKPLRSFLEDLPDRQKPGIEKRIANQAEVFVSQDPVAHLELAEAFLVSAYEQRETDPMYAEFLFKDARRTARIALCTG